MTEGHLPHFVKFPAVPGAKQLPSACRWVCIDAVGCYWIDILIHRRICFLNIYVALCMEKKDRNSVTNKGHIFPFSSFYHPVLQPPGAVELPRAPSAAKIVEVGERLWSSTQTGQRAQPGRRFSEGKVLQLLRRLRNLPHPLIVCKSQEYSSWIVLLPEPWPAGGPPGAVSARLRMATRRP